LQHPESIQYYSADADADADADVGWREPIYFANKLPCHNVKVV
jgi:hypothetical protein